jgi:hypothetical protein
VRHEDIPSKFPENNLDENVVVPPNDPVAGKFYDDEFEGIIYIPEEYANDTAGYPGKLIAAGQDRAIVMKAQGDIIPVKAVGWLGFIRSNGLKAVSGVVELYPTSLRAVAGFECIDQILILDRDKNVIGLINPELNLPVFEELIVTADDSISVPFRATDDVELKEAPIGMAPIPQPEEPEDTPSRVEVGN